MTAYSPNPTVTVAGVDYTGQTVNRVSIRMGRDSITEQPRAGYAVIELLTGDGLPPAISLNDLAHVAILNSAGTDPYIFTGYVTDIQRSITAWGDLGNITSTSVTVLGPLTRTNRFTTAASYAKQFDGDRIAAILTDVFTTSWTEYDPSVRWSAVPSTQTWLTIDPGYTGSVDQPGSFEIEAYSGGEVAAVSLLGQVADSAMGVLWEDGDGNINYSDAASRVNDVAANGYLTIPSAHLSPAGLSSQLSSANLVNALTITYKANASVSGEDIQSQYLYGVQGAQRSTLLESAAAATQQLDLLLDARAFPRTNLSNVTIPLDNPNLPDAIRDALISVYVGMPVEFPDLPSAIHPYPFRGFVEGWNWQATQRQAAITLSVSEYALHALQAAWIQVASTEAWNTLTNTLTWENAEVVA